MNKQEVLKKLEQKKETILRSQKNLLMKSELWGLYEARATTFMSAINIVEQLDEPQRVEVTEEFDAWYKDIKKSWADIESAKQFALWKICQYGFGCGFEDVNGNRTSNTLSDWVSYHREDAINAVWHGYEVEKEPRYKVIMPNPQSKNGNVIVLRRTQAGTITVNKVKEITARISEGMDLTEKEIKSVDERYWPFAVPVEKV